MFLQSSSSSRNRFAQCKHKTQIFVLTRDPFFRVVTDALVVGGLGMCQGRVWTGSYKGFAGFGKGGRHILLIGGEFGRGICRTKKFEIRPEPKRPKNVPKGPRRPPGPPKNYKSYFCPPGPLLGPRGPRGPYITPDQPAVLACTGNIGLVWDVVNFCPMPVADRMKGEESTLKEPRTLETE